MRIRKLLIYIKNFTFLDSNFFFEFNLSFIIGEARTCVREITSSFLKKERTASKEARKDDT